MPAAGDPALGGRRGRSEDAPGVHVRGSGGPDARPGAARCGGIAVAVARARGVGRAQLTGHWAIAGTSGIDLVQRGTALTGTSSMGISVSGTVSGRDVVFRWWRGASYEAARKVDRGTGTMTLGPSGEDLSIAAKDDEAGPGPFPTALEAIRVHDITTPSASPQPYSWYWTEDDLLKIVPYTRARAGC